MKGSCGNGGLVFEKSLMDIAQTFYHSFSWYVIKFNHIAGKTLADLDKTHCIVFYRLRIIS